MNEFYKIINELSPNSESMTVTVLDGSSIGEKAILCNGEVAYLSSPEKGLLAEHAEELKELKDSGIEEFFGAQIYTERIGHGKKLVICGAGHVSMPIIQIGRMVGMYVTAIDDRPYFAENARKAGANEVFCEPFTEALQKIDGDPDTYFVIVTRGHQWDSECLRNILKKPHAYIGMMGSKRRVGIVKQTMIEEGFDETLVNSLHSPIGLPINSETPEEIAVSVMAEIINEKNKVKDFTYPEDIMRMIAGSGKEEPKYGHLVMATIVARKGSAPREVGTKMLIASDGSCVNTIGGGCVEADVITTAKEMLLEETFEPQVIHVDLLADEAALEGEVCGGVLDVLMEEVVL